MGIAVGDLIHTLAAVVGLSAILMTSTLAFGVVKYLGSAYLVYLGIRALLEKSKKLKNLLLRK
ncbi:LysE family transporter [Peribacillus simplex]|uniref:LysE family transporter n=1 Tax=Peribacillus simplex TaxID=1478 RepID=UPI0032679B10